MEEREFDFKKISKSLEEGQYERHLSSLGEGFYLDSIKESVEQSLKNIRAGVNSFIIHGEPQSGKTEMMISLTAKLLDEGNNTIIILVTDQDTLLSQNLLRFRKSGLSPSPRSYKEIIGKNFEVKGETLIILCKKNSSNLKKLISKLRERDFKIIIDDEADFATPNSKINIKEISKINELTKNLIAGGGVYIGVTATPARLDLNNTHKTKTAAWVPFKPHPKYTGQDDFFPEDLSKIKYKINFLPENYDSTYLKDALFTFLINVAYLNTTLPEMGYSMIVHTSRKKIDHSEDQKEIAKIMQNLSQNKMGEESEKIWKEIWERAKSLHDGKEDDIANYIFNNIERHEIKVLNSNRDKTLDSEATNPLDPFTIIIGGDIVSRGMTFDRLLSMFFTRDVKTIFNQDTYIQRARMFGSRKDYLKYFELSIPKELFSDWHTSFMMHRLSLQSISFGNGPPVWIGSGRIRSTGSSSIDKGTVMINKGEIVSDLFEYRKEIKDALSETGSSPLEKIKSIQSVIGGDALPDFIIKFMEENWLGNGETIRIKTSDANEWGEDVDKEQILRPRRFIRGEEGVHQFLIVYNNNSGKARLFFRPSTSKLHFLINYPRQVPQEPPPKTLIPKSL